jgi:cytochrome c-type biogenesis protein CcmF
LVSPRKVFAAMGLALGAWLILGSLVEMAARVRLGAAPLVETARRAKGLPRGAWGMTLAHIGLGVFALGASVETAWKVEAVETLSPGGSLQVGAFHLTLREVATVRGPNYEAERGLISVRGPGGVSEIAPERRFYPTNRQTTSQVALQQHGVSDLYVVLGERREVEGRGVWLVRAYWNPWARLIFAGPLLMALGGLVSLSDRRLRIAAGARTGRGALVPEPAE